MLEIRKDKNNMAKKKTAEKALNIDHIYLTVEIFCGRHVIRVHFLKKEI